MHESFLSRLEDRTDCAYDFGWHNFHSNGFGGYKAGGRPTPLPYTRWSINVFAFVRSDLGHADAENLVGDDESEVSYAIPMRSGKPACAVGKALVAHYSYSKQEDGLLNHTNLLERYLMLASVTTGDVVTDAQTEV
jgi:hypothetical protein